MHKKRKNLNTSFRRRKLHSDNSALIRVNGAALTTCPILKLFHSITLTNADENTNAKSSVCPLLYGSIRLIKFIIMLMVIVFVKAINKHGLTNVKK